MAGEEIPLCGRIVAVADVYDALTSRRVYKEAFSHVVACSIITEDAGKHFDPDVVSAFLAVQPQFLEIRQQLHESAATIASVAAWTASNSSAVLT